MWAFVPKIASKTVGLSFSTVAAAGESWRRISKRCHCKTVYITIKYKGTAIVWQHWHEEEDKDVDDDGPVYVMNQKTAIGHGIARVSGCLSQNIRVRGLPSGLPLHLRLLHQVLADSVGFEMFSLLSSTSGTQDISLMCSVFRMSIDFTEMTLSSSRIVSTRNYTFEFQEFHYVPSWSSPSLKLYLSTSTSLYLHCCAKFEI